MKNKKKFFTAIALSAIAVISAFGLGACNERDDFRLLSDALQKELFAENLTVTTTDTRTDKFGYSVPRVIMSQADENGGKYFSDDTDHPTLPNRQYTVSNKEADRLYLNTCIEKTNLQNTEHRLEISMHEIDLTMHGDYGKDKYTAAQWIGRFLGYRSDVIWMNNSCFSANDGGPQYNFENTIRNIFQCEEFPYTYTKATNTYAFPDIYYVMRENDETLGYCSCSLTIKLDAQNRFSNVVCSFPGNGAITSVYEYGNAAVEIPQNILDAMNAP